MHPQPLELAQGQGSPSFPSPTPSPCNVRLDPAPAGSPWKHLRKAALPLEVSCLQHVVSTLSFILQPGVFSCLAELGFLAIHLQRPHDHCRGSLGPGRVPTSARPALVFSPVSKVLHRPLASLSRLWMTITGQYHTCALEDLHTLLM